MMNVSEARSVPIYHNEVLQGTMDVVMFMTQGKTHFMAFTPKTAVETKKQMIAKTFKALLGVEDAAGNQVQGQSPEAPKPGPQLVPQKDTAGEPEGNA